MILHLNQDLIIQLLAFTSVLTTMLVWEWFSPRRTGVKNHWRRRSHNLLLILTGTLLIRITLPALVVISAEITSAGGWGIINLIHPGYWYAVVFSLIALDLVIYCQHLVLHKFHPLWRIHRVHHTDMEIDVTTAVRIHPIEIFLSFCLKIIAIILLGAPTLAIMLFEIMLNSSSLFNHGNVHIPPALDRYLRWIIVTPDMHRVHHSVYHEETDSNYGFNLPWWDRLFGTYRAQPRDGHQGMRIGLNEFRNNKSVNVLWLLAQPFLQTGTTGNNTGENE